MNSRLKEALKVLGNIVKTFIIWFLLLLPFLYLEVLHAGTIPEVVHELSQRGLRVPIFTMYAIGVLDLMSNHYFLHPHFVAAFFALLIRENNKVGLKITLWIYVPFTLVMTGCILYPVFVK